LIIPEISTPLKSHHKHVGHLTYLKGLKLAHPVSGDEDFDIEILIGADHYWDVVQDEVIRDDGPTVIQSKIGYLLSGPLKTDTEIKSPSIPISIINVMTVITQNEHISRPRTMPHHPVRKESEKICVKNDRTLIYTFMYTDLIDPSHLLYRRRITSPIYPDDRELTTRGFNEPVEELYRLIDSTLKHFFSRWKHKYLTLLRESH
jgi:hypothetical protein